MNRRASVPGADELFRSGGGSGPRPTTEAAARTTRSNGASGRTPHDEKITVYLTQQELVDLEQARLRLRAEYAIAVDRGRIVREAIAALLADLEERGPASTVVGNLS